ncbi:alkylated DNA nucleotide flippase Atl1 [Streptomyces tendae]
MSEESLPDTARPEHADALPEYAERVLEVAELIPPGRVMTYGDVAEWLEEGGPRQVGRVMALYGGAVPWWRVVRARTASCCPATNCGRWSTTAPRAPP